MWGIWDYAANDWISEPTQEYTAVLAFRTKRDACGRAAMCWGFGTYSEAKKNGWCEVRRLASPAKRMPRRRKVVRKRGA